MTRPGSLSSSLQDMGGGGEEEQAVVSTIREFQVCGMCYLGVSSCLGVSALGVGIHEFHVQSPTERPPNPDTGPGALSYTSES